MRKINTIIERACDGTFSIYSDADDLDYLVIGTGTTIEEAKHDYEEGYEEMKRFYARDGKPFVEVQWTYKYDVASMIAYSCQTHSLADLSWLTGISPKQLSQYIIGGCTPKPRTAEKIVAAIINYEAGTQNDKPQQIKKESEMNETKQDPAIISDMRRRLSDIQLAISWREFANKYFQRSSSWFYHKMDGIDGNGGTEGFNEQEAEQMRAALIDLSERIRRAAEAI